MSVRGVMLRDGMYYGNKSVDRAKAILAIREADKVESLKRKIFNFPPELVERSIEEGRSIREIVKEENVDYSGYIGEMRDYQTVGTAFMYYSPRSIIGDGVGLGKTIEISGLINILRENNEMGRFFIAVESTALKQTQAELIRFTGFNIVVIPSQAAKLRRVLNKLDWRKIDGVVMSHSTLRSTVLSQWLAINMREDGTCRAFDTFFLDESSIIKNNETKMYEYVENLCNISKRVHFMNATTFEKSIMDIYYQIDALDKTVLPPKSRITKEFCKYQSKFYWTKASGVAERKRSFDLAGYKNQEVFKNSLKLCYFGRCKKDVGIDTPHIYKVYEVEPSNEQSSAISKGYRYNTVLNCPNLIPELKLENNRKTNPKLNRVCELVEREFDGQQVMIYCFHVSAQEALKTELEKIGRKCVILNGQDHSSEKDENRARIQKEFNDGVYDVIITNIKRSLNLNSGDVCIFYEYSSTPASMEQIRGRIDRNTDDRVKTFILLLYKGTDEYKLFTDVVKSRSKDGRDLTIDAENCIDYFINSMDLDEGDE